MTENLVNCILNYKGRCGFNKQILTQMSMSNQWPGFFRPDTSHIGPAVLFEKPVEMTDEVFT